MEVWEVLMLLHSRPATMLMLISLLAQSFLSPFIYFASALSSVPIRDYNNEALIEHVQRNPVRDLRLPTEDLLYSRILSTPVEGTDNSQTNKDQVDVPLGVWPGDNREFFGKVTRRNSFLHVTAVPVQ